LFDGNEELFLKGYLLNKKRFLTVQVISWTGGVNLQKEYFVGQEIIL
jgi:hypothetical protein